jgi:hypothetical protein
MAVLESVRIAPRVIPRLEVPPARRFDLPDIERHGRWFLPRFLERFPHLNQQQAIGFLRGVLYNNEFLFLCHEHAVALAQAVSDHTLQPETIIWERFVMVEDPEDEVHIEQGAAFYDDFRAWAHRKNVKKIVIEQCTDVSRKRIAEKLGELNPTELMIVKV